VDRLSEAALPLPQTNHVVGGRRVDCRWPEEELTVELDGYRFHRSLHAWEQDRRREPEARAHGDEFRRYTYGDVLESPQLMMAELRALLSGPALMESALEPVLLDQPPPRLPVHPESVFLLDGAQLLEVRRARR
jgi:hypothetical protein